MPNLLPRRFLGLDLAVDLGSATARGRVRRAGAAAVAFAPEPLAAAIRADLDLGLPYARLGNSFETGIEASGANRGVALSARPRTVLLS